MASQPRVGLVIGAVAEAAGLQISSLRHIRLLADELTIVPISLEASSDARDWCGRVEPADFVDGPGYRVFAADFNVDTHLGLTDHSSRAYADHIVRIARREQLSALHVYGAFELRPFVGAFAAAETGVPLIITFRGADINLRIFGKTLAHLQSALHVATACVCVSTSAKHLLERLVAPRCPIHVVHNHVDPGDFEDHRDATSVRSLDRPVIGTVGEFRRITGIDFLLRSFDEIASRRAGSLLLVGPFRAMEAMYYASLVDNLRSSERIHRVGRVPHELVLSYLRACDVVAFPSLSDGCPNKVLEAMLAGVAIVASNVGAIPELLRDRVDGILIDPRAERELTDAIEELLDDPSKRQTYGASARQRARTAFSPSHEHDAWIECYRKAGLCI